MTGTLAWQERFSVGVRGIDRQHRALLARLDAVFRAVAAHEPEEQVESLVALLKRYVHTHFGCEERLMRRHAYPGYARHLSEHERFLDELGGLDDLYERAGACAATAAPLAGFVVTWLVEHFRTEDLDLADHLRAGAARRPIPPAGTRAPRAARRRVAARSVP